MSALLPSQHPSETAPTATTTSASEKLSQLITETECDEAAYGKFA